MNLSSIRTSGSRKLADQKDIGRDFILREASLTEFSDFLRADVGSFFRRYEGCAGWPFRPIYSHYLAAYDFRVFLDKTFDFLWIYEKSTEP